MGEVAAPVRDGDDVLAPVLGADRPKLVEVAVLLELRKPELLNDVIRLEGTRNTNDSSPFASVTGPSTTNPSIHFAKVNT